MTTSPLRAIAISTLLALTFTAPLVAQQQPRPRFGFVPGPKAGGGEVKINLAPGGRIEAEKDEYSILEGDVTIEYQDIKLRADKITYNQKTKDVVAEGHVIIDQGPTRVTATQTVYNLETKTGTFFNATGTMDPSMFFSGDRIEKIDEDSYKLTNGVFTSCDLDRPAWSFHVGSAEINVDDYAYLRDLSFRARNIPIFWAPRLVWPTKRDRSKGFLIPRVQHHTRFGERLSLGYFIPLGQSADATINADLNNRRYFGAGINVRYVPSQNVKIGDLEANVVNNAEPDFGRVNPDPSVPREEPRLEWKYRYQHAQENLPGGFRGVVDVQDFSNLDFFREYDRQQDIHTLSNIYSSAYLTRNRPRYSLNVLADRREIVLGNIEQRFQQLPSLQLRMYPQRVGNTPFYFSMESSASHLRTDGDRVPSADYYRTDIFPTVSLQLRTPAWFSIKPQLSVRGTQYSASLDPTSTSTSTVADESLSRYYGQGQVEVVGPSFSKIFNREVGGFSRFKHVIEPRFRYVYTTNVNDQERVIRFDTVDSPFLPIVRDSVEYSLTQRIIGREKEGATPGQQANAREIVSFSLRQTASLSKPFNTTTGGSQLQNHKFTPLVASLHVNPYQNITLDASTTFGNVSHQLDQSSISANLVGTGKLSDKYLSFTWFASYLAPGQTTGDSSQFRINTGSSLWRDRIRADVQVNFDAAKGRFLEQRYLLGGSGSCYGIALEYRRYLVYQPLERAVEDYGISITLKNVGTISAK